MSEQLPGSEGLSPRGGLQVDAGLFSRVQQLIQSVRLTQEERVAVETGEVASEVHMARKEFEMGHIEQAFRGVNRVSGAFDQKVAQWEQRARKKELEKQKLSMLQIRKMQAEHAGVRTRVNLVKAQLRRLRSGLDQLDNLIQNQAAAAKAAAVEQPPTAESCVPQTGQVGAGLEPQPPANSPTRPDSPSV